MSDVPSVIPPNTENVSPSALSQAPGIVPAKPAAAAAAAQSNDKKLSLKDKIANFANESRDATPPTPQTPAEPTPGSNNVLPVNTPSVPSPGQQPVSVPNTESKDFKALKTALDQKEAKLKELDEELAKLRPSAERVQTLEAELAAKEADYNEVKEFRAKTGLLNSDTFYKQIVQPRQQIADHIKAELKADGIDENVWDLAQQVTTRGQLEALVKEKIDSDLLRSEFYTRFFQDQELRKQEQSALAAPSAYLEKIKRDEAAHRNQLREMTEKNFGSTFQQAIQDAAQMSSTMGENKLIELMELPDNPQHNEKVVKPILEAAYKGAEADLKERIALGLEVTRQDAARKIYLWTQAVAAQAANKDRLRWYQTAQQLEEEVVRLREQLEIKTARNNPTPGGREAAPAPSGNGFQRGKNLTETIGNFVNSVKAGEV